MATYTVKKGDTLSEIAWKYNSTYHYGSNSVAAYKRLAAINNIISPHYRIYVGQVLTLNNPSGPIKKPRNSSKMPKIQAYGLQSDADNTAFVTWIWSKKHTASYTVEWQYDTGDGIWFAGSKNTETYKQSTYSIPSNARRVRVRVIAVASKHKVNKKNVAYWKGKWCSFKYLELRSVQPPDKPSAPSVEINKYKLTAKVDNLADGINIAKKIEFYVVKNNSSKKFASSIVNVVNRSASASYTIDPGGKYKVKCRAIRDTLKSDWSDFSSEASTIPSAPKEITSIKALSETGIQLSWRSVSNVTSYEVQYTTKTMYFDSNPDEVKSKTIETGTHAEITGLDSGAEYFFRVRAVNEQGKSGWTGTKSIVIGKKPGPPTTWSSTTTAMVGETLTLYWVHNSQDNSYQRKSELELIIDGVTQDPIEKSYTPNEDEAEPIYSYPIDTTVYTEGSKIQWRVRTAGVTGVFGDWSVQRTVDIYAPPSLELRITNSDDDDINVLTSFPFYVKGLAGPKSQAPIGYSLSVISTEDYSTTDQVGDEKLIGAGDSVYSKYFDIKTDLLTELSANNIDLESGKTYKVVCVVTMNSGLTAEASSEFTVDWTDETYDPDAEILYNENTYSCSIRAYCMETADEYYPDEESDEEVTDDVNEDAEETLVEGITLSIYRRDYNGEFIEIATGLENTNNTYVTDVHPALDYGRYRIIAVSKATGAVSFSDIPGEPIGETSAIIQWDESWSDLVTSTDSEEDERADPTWTGSRVVLPYNIDVSDKNDVDVSLVKYIGRKRPVSYYGTQLGETSSWKVEIPKDDAETLYALRRLAIWTGDVYVREPSGSGYWANVSVSISQTHCQVTIPVTLEITRVEGGV